MPSEGPPWTRPRPQQRKVTNARAHQIIGPATRSRLTSTLRELRHTNCGKRSCHSNCHSPGSRPTDYPAKPPQTWSPLTESNRRPSPYHGDALPTELRGRTPGLRTVPATPRGCPGRPHAVRHIRARRAYTPAAVLPNRPIGCAACGPDQRACQRIHRRKSPRTKSTGPRMSRPERASVATGRPAVPVCQDHSPAREKPDDERYRRGPGQHRPAGATRTARHTWLTTLACANTRPPHCGGFFFGSVGTAGVAPGVEGG